MFRTSGSKPLDLIKVLSALRTKALRAGVWFASLSHEDRILASLINRHIKIVKNTTLAVVIARIMGKLFYAMKHSSFWSKIAGIGRPIAQMFSERAYSMGNKDALKWGDDPDYIRYLGLMEYHSNSMTRLLLQNAGAVQ
jgi:hypothetical protein